MPKSDTNRLTIWNTGEMPTSRSRSSRRPFKLIAALALTLGAGALVPATTATAAPCGRASGCTKFELITAASTYDWWPWAKDPASSKIRHEFRSAEGNKAPARWGKYGKFDWRIGSDANGTITTSAPSVSALPVQQSSVVWASGKKTGRWEIRYRTQSQNETQTGDYRVQVELVPSGPYKRCEPKSITMVTYDPSTPTVAKFGITRPGVNLAVGMTVKTPPLSVRNDAEWKKGNDPKTSGWHVWAVEVSKGHISWFVDGRVIRRETRKAAMFTEALNLRISMVSDPNGPTAESRGQLDWARYFSLKRTTKNKKLVKQLKSAKPLTPQKTQINPSCS